MKENAEPRNILVAVDVQNDFISGSLAVNEGEEVVEPLNNLAAAVRQTGGDVVFTRDWHPCNTLHFNDWPAHCIRHTEGAAFHPDLIVEPQDTIISKGTERLQHGYSGWEGRSKDGARLEAIITPRTSAERVRVFIGGLATDYCVKATTLDIANHFEDDERIFLYLLRDAIRAVNLGPTDGEEALKAILDANVAAISCEDARNLIEKEF